MARNRSNIAAEDDDDAPEIGEWIVTFSDCMTLLLCFFVLLLTFSSFEEVEYQKLAGAFDYMSLHSIFPHKRAIKDSAVAPVPREVDQVAVGADVAQEIADLIEIPRNLPEILAIDAYKDRRVFVVSSRKFFWGRGSVLTFKAKRWLALIAAFVDKVPCRVHVAENSAEQGLERSWAVLWFLTEKAGLPADRCFISAPRVRLPEDLGAEPVVEISLLSGRAY
jgi:hypothetical protein